MSILSNNFTPNSPLKFCCNICDFYSSNKKDFNRHIQTIKHKINNEHLLTTNFTQKTPNHICNTCGKTYHDRSGLWRHNKKYHTEHTNLNLSDTELIIQILKHNTELLKENSEFKQLMMEQNKHMIELSKNAGHNHTNIHNQSFNLQFFLNETCKNAMNIMDFVSQLQVGNNDLEETGRLGFAEGISKIFINGLKQINVNDRPIHCSDVKRETLYIKNNNEWNKETDEKALLTNAIKHVAHKNIKQISEWTKSHPEYKDSESKVNDRYLQIVSESMSGSTIEETNKNYNKIIKSIIRETVIDK